jgi:hypothetical protein
MREFIGKFMHIRNRMSDMNSTAKCFTYQVIFVNILHESLLLLDNGKGNRAQN